MSKIIIITNRLVVGGPSVHLLQIIEYFQNKHTLLLVHGKVYKAEESVEEAFRKTGVEMIKVDTLKRSFNLFHDIQFAKILKQILIDFQPDIVHTHTNKPGFSGRIVAAQLNVPKVIHTYHGLIFKGYFSAVVSKALIYLDRYLAKKTDIIISLSENQQKEIVEKFKIATKSKVTIIPLATSFILSDFNEQLAQKFKQRWQIEKDTMVMGQVGRLTAIKDIAFMLDTFSDVKKKANRTCVLVIAGDGELKNDLVEQAFSLHLKVAVDRPRKDVDVIFTSWCKDLKALYSAMDLLGLTSRSEGTPLNIIEAQTAGVAVIAPKVGGIEDLVLEGETALLFEKANEFEPKLLELINNKLLLDEMKMNAAQFANSKFSLDKMLKSYENLYKL